MIEESGKEIEEFLAEPPNNEEQPIIDHSERSVYDDDPQDVFDDDDFGWEED